MISPTALILAAGLGRRMRSEKPKVLVPALGYPLFRYGFDALLQASVKRFVFVIRESFLDEMQANLGDVSAKKNSIDFAFQNNPQGTAHAVLIGLKKLRKQAQIKPTSPILITYGDMPLITKASFQKLIKLFHQTKADLSLVTAKLDNPYGYGRIVRGADGEINQIIEEKDATKAQKQISEINTGIMLARADRLWSWLGKVNKNNAQKELYLTDVVAIAKKEGHKVNTHLLSDFEEALGANRLEDLTEIETILLNRKKALLQKKGVRLTLPAQIYCDWQAEVGEGSSLFGPCYLRGKTKIGKQVLVEPGCVITNSQVGDGSQLLAYSYLNSANLSKNCTVGPFTHLRPGAILKKEAKVGNFSEVKKSTLGVGAKVNHLSYIGDATVGAKVNIGAGTITCNYDGVAKSQTKIGANVFIGSDTQLVAPVVIGKGAFIAAGSTITKNVAPNSLALTRIREMTQIKNWSQKRKQKSESQKK